MKNNIIKFLLKLKNASLVRKEKIVVNNQKAILPLLNILYREGYIQSFFLQDKEIVILLRYNYNKNIFKNLKIFSKISQLVYLSYSDICRVYNNNIILVFSTNKGYLTNMQCKKYKIGGQLLFSC